MAKAKTTQTQETLLEEKVETTTPIEKDTAEETLEYAKELPVNLALAELKKQKGEMVKRATKTQVVTINSNDTRINNSDNTALLSVVNPYFELSKIVPLGIPVELEQCLIDNAEEATILVHKPKVGPDGKTMNHEAKLIKKFTISYGVPKGSTPEVAITGTKNTDIR